MAIDFFKVPGAPPPGTHLCARSELSDPGARGFRFGSGVSFIQIFLVRKGERIAAYVNSCPHVGSPLDFPEGHFFTPDGTLLRCATHGARFRIEDGYCVSGPCQGARLWPVPIHLAGGDIRLGAASG